MQDSVNTTLARAHALIEADQTAEARALLEPLTLANPDDPNVWWVYAHAVDDIQGARDAVRQVLRLDPTYPGARDLLTEIETALGEPVAAPVTPAPTIRPLTPLPPPPAPAPATTAPLPTTEAPRQRGGMVGLLIALVAVVLLAVFAYYLWNSLQRSDTPQTGTSLAELPTVVNAVPTVLSTVPATEALIAPVVPTDALVIPATAEAQAADTATLVATETVNAATETVSLPTAELATGAVATDALAVIATDALAAPAATDTVEGNAGGLEATLSQQFTLADPATQTVATRLGETLLLGVCTTAAERQTVLAEALTVLAQQPDLPEQAEAVGVRLVACDSATTLRAVAVPVDVATQYAAGSIGAIEFQSAWQSVNVQ